MTAKTDHLWMIPVGLALVLVLMGAAAFAAARHYGGRFSERASWPSTEGVVVTNFVSTYKTRNSKTGFTEDRSARNFEYTYAVDGRTYTGSEYGYDDSGPIDMGARYPVGTKTPVFYDPADPSQAALVVGASISPTPFHVLGSGLLVLALPFGYAAYRMAIRRRN